MSHKYLIIVDMIVHVLNLSLSSYQLNFSIVRSLIAFNKDIKLEKRKPFFLCYGNIRTEILDKYDALFKELGYTEYYFCHTFKALYNFVHSHKNECYLLHGVHYECMFKIIVFGAKKLNWVCWGAGASINYSNWKSILFTPIKRWIYHHFCSTVVLLEGDKRTLEQDFNQKNITLLSYYPVTKERMRDLYDILRTNCERNDKPVVYLGNSGNCANSYLELLPKLRRYAGKIELHCMWQYAATSFKAYENKVIDLGNRLFGKDFHIDKTYMDRDAYLRYMNRCDIYICGQKTQSGLGAINTCLSLGKKVYISGKNYEHIKNNSYKIFNLSTLDDSFTEPLSEEDNLKNYSLQFSKFEPIKKGWLKYLSSL